MSESRTPNPEAPAEIPADLVRSWNQTAEQLFGSALSRPDIYQRVTTLIGATATALRERHAGAEELLAACAAPDATLAAILVGDPRVSLDGLDPTKLVAAACAMRYREVVQENAALARKAALAAGDPHGWTVLVESGPSEGDPYLPYQRMEAHAASGLVLAVGTRPDDTFTGCVHSVDVIHIDPATGALGSDPVDAALSIECTSPAEREENVERMRRELTRSN